MRLSQILEAIASTSELANHLEYILGHEDQFVDTHIHLVTKRLNADSEIARLAALSEKIEKLRGQHTAKSTELNDAYLEIKHRIVQDFKSQILEMGILINLSVKFAAELEEAWYVAVLAYVTEQFGMIVTNPGFEGDGFEKTNWNRAVDLQIRLTRGKRNAFYDYSGRPSRVLLNTGRTPIPNDMPRSTIVLEYPLAQVREAMATVISNRILGLPAPRYNPLTDVMNQMMQDLLHEAVHLEQDIRQALSSKTRLGGVNSDYTKLPDLNQPRPEIKKDQRKYRGGRRGMLARDIAQDPRNPTKRLTYLGTVSEIEAFAADAAQSVARAISSHGTSDLNARIDQTIRDIAKNRTLMMGTNQYVDQIAPLAAAARHRPVKNDRDRQLIKVWNLFLKKLVKHLESYKR